MRTEFKHTPPRHGLFRLTKRQAFIACAIFVSIIGILLTVGAFYDYQIDVALAQPFLPNRVTGDVPVSYTPEFGGGTGALGQVYTNNTFAKVIEIVGTAPCIIATLCALAIFFHNATTIRSISLRRTIKVACVTVGMG
jgi:hypothetical protein